MNEVNFLQVGNGHCFICHKDTEPNDNHSVEHLFMGLHTTKCNKKCDPQWQISWDKLKNEYNETL